MKLKSLIGAALVAGTLISGTVMTSVASASPEPSGWDDVNDQVVGAGSDTTYPFMQRYELLYNQANGCDTNNASPAAPPVAFTLGNCLTGAAQTSTITQGNWDHDYFNSFFPTGSSAGVKALQNGQVDYARSSRGPRATGETDLNFWGFAKDGLVMVTFAGRTTGDLSKAEIQGIYNCTITNWNQIDASYPSATIEPVGMNPSSGTKASMDTYLGFDANQGACKKPLANGTFPFENDAKPVLDAANINDANAIWWMSYAEFRAFSYKRQSAASWTVDTKPATPGNIATNQYPITRFIYHVTKDAVTAAPGSSDLQGDDAGAQGAVREMTEFLCKPQASHIVNDYSGASNYAELTSIYTATGFIRLPAAEQTNGICRLVPG